MPLPHFIIAGATRAGTTSLHRHLRAHPDVFMPQRKELSFFNDDRSFARGLDHYGDMFREAGESDVLGEATPMYMEKGVFHGPDGIRLADGDSPVLRISRSLPEVKVVVTLRNPVTRYESMFLKHARTGKISAPPDEHLAMELDQGGEAYGLLYKGRYAVHLKHLLDVFPRERVMIMVFEEWTADVPRALRDLYDFLGLEHVPPPRDAGFAYNTAQRYHRLGRWVEAARRFFMADTPSRPQHPRFDFKALHPRLGAFHEPDVAFVEDILGRRLDAWR